MVVVIDRSICFCGHETIIIIVIIIIENDVLVVDVSTMVDIRRSDSSEENTFCDAIQSPLLLRL